jgi:hypothetical protein
MAAATATIAIDTTNRGWVGTKAAGAFGPKMLFGTITVVGDYATGGVACDLSTYFKELKVVLLSVGAIADLTDGLIGRYDESTKKITLYDTTGVTAGIHDEVANATTIVSTVFNFVAFGF